jgi:hypothetical protein
MKRVLSILILLAPLPEAYAVYLSITRELGWPVYFAAPSAFVVAMIGFFSIQVAERMHSYNSTLRLDEKTAKMQAPLEQAFAALAIWFVGSTALILFLDSAWVATLAPVALAVVGASGSYIKSLSDGQDEREGERGQYRERVARARTESRTASAVRKSPSKFARSASNYPRKCAHCKEMLHSPNAVGGHMKKNHPEKCKKQSLAENLFENVNK